MNPMHLGADRYLQISDFQGTDLIHLRCYESNKEKIYPTKKGIALPLVRFKILCENKNIISKALNQTKSRFVHLGGNVYVSTNAQYRTVDIRKFFIPENDIDSFRIMKKY